MKDRVVIITGGTGGLGRDVVKKFLALSSRVIVTYRIDEEKRSFGEEFQNSESLLLYKLDLASRVDCVEFASFIDKEFGRADVLINLAGGYAGGRDVHEIEDDELDRMININLKTAYNMMNAILPVMIKRQYGKIVNIGSRAAVLPSPGMSPYAASKAALVSLTQSVAAEVKKYGINVNIILPSTIDTPANRNSMPGADFSKWVSPESIAGLLNFLTSDSAADISGAVIPIYG